MNNTPPETKRDRAREIKQLCIHAFRLSSAMLFGGALSSCLGFLIHSPKFRGNAFPMVLVCGGILMMVFGMGYLLVTCWRWTKEFYWPPFKSPEERAKENNEFYEYQDWLDETIHSLQNNLSSKQFQWARLYSAFCQIMYEGLVVSSFPSEQTLVSYSLMRAPELLRDHLVKQDVEIVIDFVQLYVESKEHIRGKGREQNYLLKGALRQLSGTEDAIILISLSLYLMYSLRKAQRKGKFEKQKKKIILHYASSPYRMGVPEQSIHFTAD